MFSSIVDLLREDLPSASFFRMPGKDPKISKKDWVQEFPEVKAGLRDATLSCIEERPGQKYGHPQNLAEDRMKRLTSSTNVFHELIEQETDVTRDFQRHLSLPCRQAWDGLNVFERSQSGPPGATTDSKTIDHYFSLMVESHEYCLCAGELKPWGVIQKDEWSGAKTMGTVTKRLGQEMRGYAYKYDCPQVFVYDSRHLLIFQFHATTREDIRSQDCLIDTWVIPRSSQSHGVNITMREALDTLLRCGWMRVVGQLSRRSNIQIGEWMQEFEYWSGRPRWRHCSLNSIRLSHPDGYRRKYDAGAGRWYWHANGQFVSWSSPQLRSST